MFKWIAQAVKSLNYFSLDARARREIVELQELLYDDQKELAKIKCRISYSHKRIAELQGDWPRRLDVPLPTLTVEVRDRFAQAPYKVEGPSDSEVQNQMQQLIKRVAASPRPTITRLKPLGGKKS